MSFKTARTFIFTLAAITLACWSTNSTGLPDGPFATHYHDCCRPAFSYDHPNAHTYAPVDTCQRDGITLVPESAKMSGRNGCDGGDQFACSCMQPWVDTVDPTLAYGFGAYNIMQQPDGSIESACYLTEFQPHDQQGKPMKVHKMILQNINTSGGVGQGSWDMTLAGGGVGDYNKGCRNQWGTDWGKQYGGVSTEQDCCKMPASLRSSCLFRFTVFGNNPSLASASKRVRCPVGIIDRSGSQRQDDAQTPAYDGRTDNTGRPAPDKYQRQRGVCQNLDPLGVVSAVCGGRLPKGSGMIRQDEPVPQQASPPKSPLGQSGQPAGYGLSPSGDAPAVGQMSPQLPSTFNLPGPFSLRHRRTCSH